MSQVAAHRRERRVRDYSGDRRVLGGGYECERRSHPEAVQQQRVIRLPALGIGDHRFNVGQFARTQVVLMALGLASSPEVEAEHVHAPAHVVPLQFE